MTSPLVRTWLAARLPDWADHGYAIWRGLLHSLGITDREWDPCQIDPRYLNVPAPAGQAVAAGTRPGTAPPTLSPSPALHLVLPCGTCGAHANAPCVSRYGEQTGAHKARRDAAAAAADLGGAS